MTPNNNEISNKVKLLREQRQWTQAELSRQLGLSQSRLSEIERGQGSFTAEQFIAILRLFNVPVTHFVSERKASSEIQNALARLGAAQLQEDPNYLSSDLIREASDIVREVLIAPD